MAIIKLPSLATEAKAIDSRVEFVVNTNLSNDQKNAGVVAKVQVRHPAVTFTVTVWQKNGRRWVSEPSQKYTKEGKVSWFAQVSLLPEVKEHILSIIDSQENSAWYLEALGSRTTSVTTEANNPDLGIEAVTADSNVVMTANQIRKGILCKVNIVTTIGTLMGFTVGKSTFGNFLYGSAPTEGATEDNKRGNPTYRLTYEGLAQVMNYLHTLADFEKEVELPEEVAVENAQETQEMNDQGFESVDDDAALFR